MNNKRRFKENEEYFNRIEFDSSEYNENLEETPYNIEVETNKYRLMVGNKKEEVKIKKEKNSSCLSIFKNILLCRKKFKLGM